MTRIVILIAAVSCVMCRPDVSKESSQVDIHLEWHLDSIDVDQSRSFATLKLSNRGDMTLAGGWSLYYNQFVLIADITEADLLHYEHIAGDFHRITSLAQGFSIPPNTSVSYHLQYSGLIQRISDAPHGIYLVHANQKIQRIRELTIFGIDALTLKDLNPPTAQSRFHENAAARIQDSNDVHPLIPAPVYYRQFGDSLTLGPEISISYDPVLDSEARHLIEQLSEYIRGTHDLVESGQGDIRLVLDEQISDSDEGYTLVVDEDGIMITGASGAGIFYGIQSLMGIMPVSALGHRAVSVQLAHLIVRDVPRFAYRGLHLDVARNFHNLTHVKRVIDQMAYFKLNRLHLSLTNDEGWRLEIPGLPELTDVGSRRGHTTDESDRLYPAYGSGPDPDDPDNNGSGYYSSAKFIELLVYARQRHIAVIPEIDVPGHARAAIKAMQARQHRLLAAGDPEGAVEYLLHDPQDQSVYNSAQNFSDNVVCICQESTYRFISHVINAVVAMYAQAMAPLTAIHSGGDEVPYGVWQKSPVCALWISEHSEVESADDLGSYFQKRLMQILKVQGLTAAGWEEIVLQMNSEGHNTTAINDEFVGKPVLPYVWNSVWGLGREDMVYRLANTGYPVIMCNSAALYFDLAYNRDPDERGLSWSGFVDTRTTFGFLPLNMFATASVDIDGNPLDQEYVAGMERLTVQGAANVLGIQGQLWSESITDSDLLDYYLFPKLLALAQRAWSPMPNWVGNDNDALASLHGDWVEFSQMVGEYVLPKMGYLFGGTTYRIPLPGAVIRGDLLYANMRYPGFEIRFTTDGSEPTISSTFYDKPMRLSSGTVRLRAISLTGRMSRVVTITRE